MLVLVSLAELLGMSVWFAAAAVAPHLSERWGLSISQAGWLTTVVQLGFVAGTACAATLNLADLVPARRYFAIAALLAALANASLIAVPGYAAALGSRFLTGFFLAGVYPPAMKMIATWFRSLRGLAIGTVVGALTVGKATPYLVHATSGVRVETVVLATTLCAALAAVLIAAGYRDGPFPFERRAFSLDLAFTVWRHRETRLAIAGYLGHMWELYAMWTWIPAFMVASATARAAAGHGAVDERFADLMAFGALAAGGLGCVWAGFAARTLGYARVVQIAMAASGACSLLIGLCFGASPWLLRGRRLGPVQCAGDRGRAAPRGGYRADASDLDRLPAHHGHHADGAVDRGSDRLALVVRGAGDRAGARDRGDSKVAPLGSASQIGSRTCAGSSGGASLTARRSAMPNCRLSDRTCSSVPSDSARLRYARRS
jgi:MFS family permease